jgi:putative transposase
LRPIFWRHRPWLGELCRIAARVLVAAYVEAAPGTRPGLILFVQTFGDLANFNPHLHVLAPDGAFLRTPRSSPCQLFRSGYSPRDSGAQC